MKHLYIRGVLEQEAEKIVKKQNHIYGYKDGKQIWFYPNIKKIDEFSLGKGEKWDVSAEDEQAVYQVDLDFRISCLEMGVNANDL